MMRIGSGFDCTEFGCMRGGGGRYGTEDELFARDEEVVNSFGSLTQTMLILCVRENMECYI